MKTLIKLIAVVALTGLLFEGCVVDEENFAPTAAFTVTPNSGSFQTVFVFDASNSADPEDAIDQLQIRWDFNGDGVWDTEWISEKIYNIQYIDESIYIAGLEVKDSKGLTSQTTQTVTVSNGGGGIGNVTDPRDGQTYTSQVMGSQTWFSENLKYQSRGSWCYDDDPANCVTYGRLYDWDGAMAACPDGWHLPTDAEWKQLEMSLGMSREEADKDYGWRGTDQGKKLKSISGWIEGGEGTNSSGYNGLPGGLRDNWGDYGNITRSGVWWTSTETGPNHAWMRGVMGMSSDKDKVSRGDEMKVYGRSVRCVKD